MNIEKIEAVKTKLMDWKYRFDMGHASKELYNRDGIEAVALIEEMQRELDIYRPAPIIL